MEISHARKERAFLAAFFQKPKSPHLHFKLRRLWQDEMDELNLLADSAGAEVVGRRLQEGAAARPASLVGKGFLESLRAEVKERGIRVVIFDNELTPTQNRNLEVSLDCKVIDRTSLILDIFAARAKTREGKIQVELAQMEYLYPRLVGRWMHFSRQEGGIGMRGPGETQLEVDRRSVKKRIQDLRKRLEQICSEREVRRRKREASEIPSVSLVGYTNAGKSTLLNALSGGHEYTDDRLFATLDPVTRRVSLAQHLTVLVSDTVGFVQKLPHQLVAAFRATFEEVAHADLLIHVIDVSHPRADVQADEVLKVLREFHADAVPMLTVYNKIDLAQGQPDLPEPNAAVGSGSDKFYVSALTGSGLNDLKGAIIARLENLLPLVYLNLPMSESRLRAKLYSDGFVIHEQVNGQFMEVQARVPRKLWREIEQFLI